MKTDHPNEFETISRKRLESLKNLYQLGEQFGYKPAWAWLTFITAVHIPTQEEIIYYQKLAGYKPGWINFQISNFYGEVPYEE